MVAGLFVTFASSAEAADTWVGAHVTTGLQARSGGGDPNVGSVLSEVEGDLRVEQAEVSFRLDLDYHLDPWWFGAQNPGYSLVPHHPWPPETAVLQVGQGPGGFVRVGVTNPAYGIELWDEKDNYLASYTNGWYLYGSQSIGFLYGRRFEDGSEATGFLGYDPAWVSPTFGACYTHEGDRFGTWSGLYWLTIPAFGQIVSANEVYPADWLTLLLELHGGVAGAGALGGAQVLVDLHTGDDRVGGALRAEQRYAEPDAVAVTGIPSDWMEVAAAVRVRPVGALRLVVEGKESWPSSAAVQALAPGTGDPYFTATFLATVLSGPEPEDLWGVDEAPTEPDDAVPPDEPTAPAP
jgi:hypothetical protein